MTFTGGSGRKVHPIQHGVLVAHHPGNQTTSRAADATRRGTHAVTREPSTHAWPQGHRRRTRPLPIAHVRLAPRDAQHRRRTPRATSVPGEERPPPARLVPVRRASRAVARWDTSRGHLAVTPKCRWIVPGLCQPDSAVIIGGARTTPGFTAPTASPRRRPHRRLPLATSAVSSTRTARRLAASTSDGARSTPRRRPTPSSSSPSNPSRGRRSIH